MVSYYTLYTHEQVSLLPRLALRGFAPGTYMSTDLEWVVEDALTESELDGEDHVVIELRVLEDFLIVLTEEITEALVGPTKEEEGAWEEVEEGPETGVEVVVKPSEEEWIPVEGEEEEFEEGFEEEPEEEWSEEQEALREAAQMAEEAGIPVDIPAELWPQTITDAIKLTETAVLAHRLPASEGAVLGVPVEIVVEEQTPEEAQKEVWYRFGMERTPLAVFKEPLWKRFLHRITPWRRGR